MEQVGSSYSLYSRFIEDSRYTNAQIDDQIAHFRKMPILTQAHCIEGFEAEIAALESKQRIYLALAKVTAMLSKQKDPDLSEKDELLVTQFINRLYHEDLSKKSQQELEDYISEKLSGLNARYCFHNIHYEELCIENFAYIENLRRVHAKLIRIHQDPEKELNKDKIKQMATDFSAYIMIACLSIFTVYAASDRFISDMRKLKDELCELPEDIAAIAKDIHAQVESFKF